MVNRISVMEVYQWVMGEAQYHREQAKTGDVENRNHHTGLAQSFYQVAAKLENTEEVNPTKN